MATTEPPILIPKPAESGFVKVLVRSARGSRRTSDSSFGRSGDRVQGQGLLECASLCFMASPVLNFVVGFVVEEGIAASSQDACSEWHMQGLQLQQSRSTSRKLTPRQGSLYVNSFLRNYLGSSFNNKGILVPNIRV